MTDQNEVAVYNDCGEKIIVKKISTTKAGNFNLCIHHGDPLLDDEVMFTLSIKDRDTKTVSDKIGAAFHVAGWITSKQERDVIALAILDMTK